MTETTDKLASLLERLRDRRPKLQQVELKNLGTVYLQKPSGEDQMQVTELKLSFSKQGINALPNSVFGAAMAAVLFRNADGTKMFPDAKEGFEEHIKSDGDDLLEIYDAIMEKTGINAKAKKLVEDAEKKSLSGQTSDSGTN